MHLFLVNDDGVGAKGIMALLEAAVRRGHRVTMCAPKYQQSAASHRFTLNDPIFAAPYPVSQPGCRAWAVTGSPADCVRVGLSALIDEPVDAVISGINEGHNAGMATWYSGTVGAAREGSFHHLPAVAASIHHHATQRMLDAFAEYVIRVTEQYAQKSMPSGTILNINAPLAEPEDWKPAVYAPLNTAVYTDRYERRESPRAGTYFWLEKDSSMEPTVPDSDDDYLARGHVTLTLMGQPVMEASSEWEKLGIDC